MKVLFLDESGDHNLFTIDENYPVFVWGGVIMEQAYAEGEATDRLNAFKQEMFGTSDIILHHAEIVRTRNEFEVLKDFEFRQRFVQGLNSLMRELEYTVMACVICKEEHLKRYGDMATNPYLLCLDVLVERFCFDIGGVGNKGMIIAEKHGRILDRRLALAWKTLKLSGTYYVGADRIKNAISSFSMRSKQDNIAGLQLADLVVSPIGRHIIGKRDHDDWNIIRRKFRRNAKGEAEGYGLMTLPRKK